MQGKRDNLLTLFMLGYGFALNILGYKAIVTLCVIFFISMLGDTTAS